MTNQQLPAQGQAAQGQAAQGQAAQGQAAVDLVAQAEAQVMRLGRLLAALIERLEAGDLAASGEVPAAITAMDKALGAVFSERARRLRNDGGSAAAGVQLDLGAARDEVGRRLARLRAVARAGEVPVGAE